MSKGTYKSLQHRIDLKQEYPCDMGLLNVVREWKGLRQVGTDHTEVSKFSKNNAHEYCS